MWSSPSLKEGIELNFAIICVNETTNLFLSFRQEPQTFSFHFSYDELDASEIYNIWVGWEKQALELNSFKLNNEREKKIEQLA